MDGESIMIEQFPLAKLSGTTLGTYKLEQLLEQNTLGATFIARSTVAHTLYRVRILRLSSTITSEERLVFFGHFQRQCGELTQLLTNGQQAKHPNLLPLLDYGNTQEPLYLPYLVSPYTSMQSLTALLNAHGPIDAQTASRYLDQIATGLEYAHHHAVLHRGLSTDEVFVSEQGQLVVADLGVIRLLELSRKPSQQPMLYGNGPSAAPAPEQLRGQPAQSSTDVYAMGALLYRLLTGHRVFSSQSRDELAEMHLHSSIPSVAKWRQISVGQRDITAELDRLIAQAMAKDAHQRIQHPADLANQYAQLVVVNTARQPIVVTSAPTVATPPTLPIPSKKPRQAASVPKRRAAEQKRDTRRRTLIFIGGGAVVVVGAGAIIAEQFLHKPTSTATVGSTSSTNNSTGNTSSGQTTTGQSQGATTSSNVIARKTDVAPNSAKTFKIPNSNSPNPGVLVHLANGQFVAFDSTCTHAGCAVAYNSQDKLLECPCHGASFDPAKQAAVVQGPATTPLAPIHIAVNADGTITAG